MTEPWLRGTWRDLHPVIAAVLYCFEQAREDLEKWTAGLSDEQFWTAPESFGPLGFHVRHIGGSVDRLITYAAGRQLSADQLARLEREKEPGATRAELFRILHEDLARAEAMVRAVDPATLADAREVGRKRLPTTVGGLLVHMAEHTQRHVGEAIITAKIARQKL
jgi:hypothetical protein